MKKFLIIAGTVMLPSIALAADAISVLNKLKQILDLIIPIIITIALIGFFYGLAQYIFKADEDKEKGKAIMIYGILALFVMVSVWGLVEVVSNTFLGGSGAKTIQLPKI
ncbi:hypothetical protein ACFL22_00210 [Patescibacteria group bacterium]